MNLYVVGTGYVGLVTGTCFAAKGHHVTCIDVDAAKISRLHEGILPIYEPGLDDLVARTVATGALKFSTSLADLLKNEPTPDAIFIAVGTPSGEDGSADLQYVLAVAREIGANLRSRCVHRLSAPDEDVVVIEVQTGTYFGEDDIVRLEDRYARDKAGQ